MSFFKKEVGTGPDKEAKTKEDIKQKRGTKLAQLFNEAEDLLTRTKDGTGFFTRKEDKICELLTAITKAGGGTSFAKALFDQEYQNCSYRREKASRDNKKKYSGDGQNTLITLLWELIDKARNAKHLEDVAVKIADISGLSRSEIDRLMVNLCDIITNDRDNDRDHAVILSLIDIFASLNELRNQNWPGAEPYEISRCRTYGYPDEFITKMQDKFADVPDLRRTY